MAALWTPGTRAADSVPALLAQVARFVWSISDDSREINTGGVRKWLHLPLRKIKVCSIDHVL